MYSSRNHQIVEDLLRVFAACQTLPVLRGTGKPGASGAARRCVRYLLPGAVVRYLRPEAVCRRRGKELHVRYLRRPQR